MPARKGDKPKKAAVPPELSKYFSKIGREGGKIGAPITNAKLTPAKRKVAGRKAAAALTPEQRKARAEAAAAARWGKKK